MIKQGHFVAVYALLLMTALYLQMHSDVAVPMKTSLERFPPNISQWRMAAESQLSAQVQEVLKASDTLMREYVNEKGEKVQLYIGYHDGGHDTGEIHSPKHCLPGSGWLELSSSRTQLPVGGDTIKLVKAVYQKGEDRELFLYWYQVRGKSLSDEYSLKLAEITNSILHRRRDASFIRVSVPFQTDERKAEEIGETFVGDLLPAIENFLPT